MSTSSTVSELERRTLSKVKWYLLIYILFGQILYQFDRTNIGFAQLTMGKDLHLNAQAFGFASSIFFLSSFLMQFPAGMCFVKFGARKWLTFLMVAWGFVVLLQGFVTSGLQLTLLRFFLGLFEAGFLPGVYILITLWFKGRSHGKAMAGLLVGTALSGIIGGPFAGWVLGKHFLGLVGWRSLFVIDGALTIIWAFAALYLVYDGPEKAPWLKPDERQFMINHLAEYEAQKVADGVVEKTSLWAVLKDYRVILLFFGFGLSGFSTSIFAYFMPTLLKTVREGLSNQAVGFLAMGPPIVYGIVAYTWGKHADKTEATRHWHTVGPLVVSAAAYLLFPMAKLPILAMLCLAMVQAGTAGWFVNIWPVANMVAGKKTIARSTAFINSGNMIFSFLGPIYFGWTMDVTKKSTVGLYTCMGVLLLIFVIMNIFFFRYKAQVKEKKQTTTVVAH